MRWLPFRLVHGLAAAKECIMSEKMDIDSPNATSSRDPRLVSRPTRPPISTNPSIEKQTTASLESPSTSKSTVPPKPGDIAPLEKQDELLGGSFAQAVSGLVNAAVATAMSKSDKERLQKRKDTTEGLLKKAKAHTNFPSTAAFFQQASNDENIDLTRVDDAIKDHMSHCNQIQRSLVTTWGSLSSSSSKTQEAMKKVQNELQVAKADAAGAKAEIAKMVESGPSQTGPVKILKDRVILLERALENQSSMLNDQAKNTKINDERLASLSTEVKRSATSSPAQGSISNRAQKDIDDLFQKHMTMDSRIRSLVTYQDRMSGSMEKVSNTIDLQRKKLDNVSIDLTAAMKRKMDIFGDQLRSLEMKVAKSPVPQAPNASLDSNGTLKNMESRLKALEVKQDVPRPANDPGNQNVQALNERLDELGQLQAMKDDLQFSEMEDMKKTLTQQTEEFQALKDHYNNVSADVRNLTQANPAVAHQQIQSLSKSLMATQRVVESVKVALHSLETRYNNISTEPIVKNMVVAMQEMYPSAAQLTEQISVLKNHFEKDVVPLKGMAESLFRSHSSSMVQVQKDAASRLEEINKLKAEHTRIDQSLADLQKRPNTQDSGPSQQQSTELRSNIESLSKRLDERISKVNEQLMSKQTAEESIFQYINHERENLIKEVRSTANNLKTLITRFGEVETVNKSNAETTKTQWNQVESLVDRMHRLEESASNNHAKLLEQFDNIKKTVGSPESGLEIGTMSPVQKAEEDEDQEDQDDSADTPSNGNNAVNHLAKTNPTLALREKKKKKKRPRPSNLSNNSDDERQPESQSDSRVSTPGREGTPSTDGKKKSKKKKKRRLHQDLEPITLD